MKVRSYCSHKLPVLFIFVICFSISSNAQETPSQFWQQVRFGGGIGLSFGDGFFSGTLAPSAIYEFNDQLAFGVGLNGSYNTLKNTYKSTIIGGSVLSLFNVIRELQFSSEFELLNVNRNYDSSLGFADENYWYPALFLGGGFRSNNVTFGIRYDVLYNIDRSIYANAWAPFVRVYF